MVTTWRPRPGVNADNDANFNSIDIAARLFGKVNSSCDLIRENIDDYEGAFSFENEEAIRNINYNNAIVCLDYFYHYGIAYFYEYVLLYRIILYALGGGNDAKVLSLGFGSTIDGLALAVARSRCAYRRDPNDRSPYRETRLEYTGYDLATWGSQNPVRNDPNFFRLLSENDATGGMFRKIELFTEDDGNILNAFGDGKSITQNIIIFPKILNEFPEACVDELIKLVGQTEFPDDFFICVSHSRFKIMDGLKIVDRLVNAINRDNSYTVDDTVIDSVSRRRNLFSAEDESLVSSRPGEGYNGNQLADVLGEEYDIDFSDMKQYHRCYVHNSALNGDIGRHGRSGKSIWFEDKIFNNKFDSVIALNNELGDNYRSPLLSVTEFVFQVIRFTKR